LPDVPLGGSRWTTLLARRPRLERFELLRKCPVLGGDALVVARLACRHLRCVHPHNVWDIGTLAALRSTHFRISGPLSWTAWGTDCLEKCILDPSTAKKIPFNGVKTLRETT
jgi:hypothetical protein